jgi:hypothetical protein
MDTPSKRAKPVPTRSVSTKPITEPAQALATKMNQESRLVRAQKLQSYMTAVQNRKTGLSLMFSEHSTIRERLLMAGCISSPSSDIFSHMDPDQVLRGLLEDPDYMMQLERNFQHGDRCLFACVMVCNEVATCESLLAKSILHHSRLICLVEQETPEALEEAEKILEVLKHEGQDLLKVDKALEDAIEAWVEERKKRRTLLTKIE